MILAGVSRPALPGFPTVVLREDETMAALTVGYQPFDAIKPVLDAWVSGDLSVKKQVQAAQQNDASQQVH